MTTRRTVPLDISLSTNGGSPSNAAVRGPGLDRSPLRAHGRGRRRRLRRLLGLHGLDGGQRRVPQHPGVLPPCLGEHALVGAQRLQRRLRRPARPVRPLRRPARPAPAVQGGARRLRRRLGPLRRVHLDRDAHRVARRAGCRRGHARAGLARHRGARLLGRAPHAVAQRVGGRRRPRRRPRAHRSAAPWSISTTGAWSSSSTSPSAWWPGSSPAGW